MRLSEVPLIGADTLQRRVVELAVAIGEVYAGRELLLLVVLKGAVPFAADLMRHLEGDLRVDFVRAKSYQGSHSSGSIQITHMPEEPLAGRHVLVIEDILDTGLTAAAIMACLREQGPASLALCTLLDKPTRRTTEIKADFVGFTIDNQFVVGYGLDYNERFRQLPAVYVLNTT